jgi:hypothetical protein
MEIRRTYSNPAPHAGARVGSFRNLILKNYEARKPEFYMKAF